MPQKRSDHDPCRTTRAASNGAKGGSLRFGIIGPSRRRNGTGPYVARYLATAGMDIVAVAGTSDRTSLEAAAELNRLLGVSPYPARSPQEMIDRCLLDAVAICSPSDSHFEHLTLALDANLHVFCEKPFIWSAELAAAPQVKTILRRFAAKQLVVHLNTQWVYTLPSFMALCGSERDIQSFDMKLSPQRPGMDILCKSGPHLTSMLIALGATGEARDVSVNWSESFLTTRRPIQSANKILVLHRCVFRLCDTRMPAKDCLLCYQRARR